MPHTSVASRQRSNNPRTRNSLFDSSTFTRKLPQFNPPNRTEVGGVRTFPSFQPPTRQPVALGPGGVGPFGFQPPLREPTSGLSPILQPTTGQPDRELAQIMMLDDLRRNDRLGFARALEFIRGEELQTGTGTNAEAARLFAGTVANNPFISSEGLGQLQRGLPPLLNQIDPAFFRNTSPVIVQSLLGLLQSSGQRPEDVIAFIQAARPAGTTF